MDYIQFEFPVLGSKILRSTAVLSENLILSGFTCRFDLIRLHPLSEQVLIRLLRCSQA